MRPEEKLNMEDPDLGMSSDVDIKETISKIGETLNNNKLLIGAVALGCGAAIFLLATDSGKRLRVQIQERALDLYDDISEAVASQWDRLRDTGQDLMSRESTEQLAEDLRHVA
jgi:gas vesicle protein